MTYLEQKYNNLCELYGVRSGCWYMIHGHFSRAMFCEANRKALISEYLEWESFVEDAKKSNFIYYYGIDDFLTEYKKAVYSCLNL